MIDRISLILVITGALNWGSVALFQMDGGSPRLADRMPILSRVIYTLVALAGIWCISLLFREPKPRRI